jgi:hypothetical protein
MGVLGGLPKLGLLLPVTFGECAQAPHPMPPSMLRTQRGGMVARRGARLIKIRADKNKPYSIYIVWPQETMMYILKNLNGLIRIKVPGFKEACNLYKGPSHFAILFIRKRQQNRGG